MNDSKKMKILTAYENASQLKKKHLKRLIQLLKDEDSFVRAKVAALLINFDDIIAKKGLLKLAGDA